MAWPLTSAVDSRPVAVAALVVAGGGLATIAAAYFFQYVVLVQPCPLCLDQRKIWYAAIPLALIIGFGGLAGAPRQLVSAGAILLMLVLLFGAGFGVYQSGVEWKWWPGPQDCSGPISSFGSASSLLRQMQTTSVVRCDEPSWRFLGLSLAGYNFLISLFFAAVALCGVVLENRHKRFGF